jgi:hypothetical protein
MTLLGVIAGCLFVGSLPYWLPQQLIALRVRIFTRIDGEGAVAIPGELVDASRFKQVYSHPAANGRSRGAELSDLFWYWLSPGPEIHQEHLEPGERYDAIARTTRRMLALPRQSAEELALRCTARVLAERQIERATLVRLRDLAMPIWADFYYEVVFGRACEPPARELIVANANDVVTALKCCGLRHMAKRHRLTRFLLDELRSRELPHALPEALSAEERALYLQGVFFNTAVVQMSEATAHLMLVIAQHADVQAKLAESPGDHEYLDRVITEALRVYPLFGVSHRITSAPIALDEDTAIPAGSVLCFEHQAFHRHGFTDPERFDPDRWQQLSPRDASYIPFGVAANRPCPAQALALITLRVAASELLRRFALRSAAHHTRSLPNRGPCLLIPRAREPERWRERALLLWMCVRDRWEDVGRSLVQLVFGSYMIWEARKLRLCQRYFERHDDGGGGAVAARQSALRGLR